MDAHRRTELARVAAPVAFLIVVTIAVLLVRSSLHHGSATPAPAPAKSRRHHRPARAVVPVAGTTSTATYVPATTVVTGRPYTVAAGDTLETIAAKQHTTVADLLRANPGIAPTSLQIGQKLVIPG
jgi:LysM repeat protein